MRFLSLYMVAAVLAGCGGAGGDTASRVGNGRPVLPDTQTIDGVLVMRHDAGAIDRAPAWRLDSAPQVVIDGGAEFDLSYANPPILLADGRSAVLKSLGGGQLVLFDAAGKPVREIARRGSGPGELMAPSGAALLPGDTIVVADDANNAINWYTADSGLVRTRRLKTTWPIYCYRSTGQLPDLRQVAIGYCTSNVLSADRRTVIGTTPLVLFSLDRSRFDTVRVIPGIETRMIEVRQGDRSFPSARNVELGHFPTATAVDSTIVLAGGVGGYVIDLLAPDGRSTGRIVVDRPVEPVTDSIKQAAIAERIRQVDETPYEGGVDLDRIKDEARNAPYADSLPPYSRVMPGGDGVFWVLDRQLPGDSTWAATAFRLDGVIIGRLAGTAAMGYPARFLGDRVMLKQTDGDGVVRYGVFHLVKGEG